MRVGTACPKLSIGNISYNIEQINQLIKRAIKEEIKVLTFPELCVTGYTCGDLFYQRHLLSTTEMEILKLLLKTKNYDILFIIGAPIMKDNQLFNCAIICFKGEILGIVPKTFIPNYNEFYEKRYFQPSNSLLNNEIHFCGRNVKISKNLLFKERETELNLGVEICEDLWANIAPSNYMTLNGANVICNLSASNETISKKEYRKDLVRMQSARCICSYIYSSAGEEESTSDLVFSGHQIIANNGSVLNEKIFEMDSIIYSDIDIELLINDRMKMNTYMGNKTNMQFEEIEFTFDSCKETLMTPKKLPFVPIDSHLRSKRCQDIINIQATGLKQRLLKTGISKAVIGISGGLDSTLALLVTIEAFKKANLPIENIIGITMPGFGTTKRTKNNSIELMKEFGLSIKNISIKEACIQHYADINHDINIQDVTYENAQARERTQILMDIANQEHGLVIGTGDLSELALGWCTYNGDHMSNYSVNTSIPKTLVKHLVMTKAIEYEEEGSLKISKILKDIIDTPVSPELLPPDKETDTIIQKTEESIGSYEMNDFFLYHFIRYNESPEKILALAKLVFSDTFSEEELKKGLNNFYKRFFTQQFKRNALPDGPKVGSISLSPRGDWRMPSDASFAEFLQ